MKIKIKHTKSALFTLLVIYLLTASFAAAGSWIDDSNADINGNHIEGTDHWISTQYPAITEVDWNQQVLEIYNKANDCGTCASRAGVQMWFKITYDLGYQEPISSLRTTDHDYRTEALIYLKGNYDTEEGEENEMKITLRTYYMNGNGELSLNTKTWIYLSPQQWDGLYSFKSDSYSPPVGIYMYAEVEFFIRNNGFLTTDFQSGANHIEFQEIVFQKYLTGGGGSGGGSGIGSGCTGIFCFT